MRISSLLGVITATAYAAPINILIAFEEATQERRPLSPSTHQTCVFMPPGQECPSGLGYCWTAKNGSKFCCDQCPNHGSFYSTMGNGKLQL
ncbi:hypothetical protein BDW74DRAFT_154582 [Aspergillus multicolor]|uniref:uncharacterized protein n=1 Tax=Aspergillus multicolor TaxID=41759 RepID=UPI003CCD426B